MIAYVGLSLTLLAFNLQEALPTHKKAVLRLCCTHTIMQETFFLGFLRVIPNCKWRQRWNTVYFGTGEYWKGVVHADGALCTDREARMEHRMWGTLVCRVLEGCGACRPDLWALSDGLQPDALLSNACFSDKTLHHNSNHTVLHSQNLW